MGEAQELLRAARATVVGSARTAVGPCLHWPAASPRLAGETLHRPSAYAGDNPGYASDGCVLQCSTDATSNEAGFSLTKWTGLGIFQYVLCLNLAKLDPAWVSQA